MSSPSSLKSQDLAPEDRPDAGFIGQLRDFARLLRRDHQGRALMGLIGGIVVVIGLTAFMQIQLNAWNQPFYDALTRKDFAAFLTQLGVFGILAGLLLVLNVSQTWIDRTLKLSLRRGLVASVLASWLVPGKALALARAGRIGENPDQRLQADIDLLADLTVALGVGLFQASLLLFSFIGVLWHHSEGLTITLSGHTYVIPGFMVWCALAYAGLASWLSWRVGRRLVPMTAESAAREADFRFEIVRVNEAAEKVTLARGEAAEARRIEAAFARLVVMLKSVIRATVGLTWVTAGSGWLTQIAPIVAAAPFYFSTDMTIGELMLVVGAFNQVQGSLRWFINNFASIATWRATLFRVIAFQRALDRLEGVDCTAAQGNITRAISSGGIEISGLRIATPQITVRLSEDHIRLAPGERMLLRGSSGSGKTLLFRAIAGLAEEGEGCLALPAPERVQFIPTRAYLPPGRLCDVLAYPDAAESFPRERMVSALAAVGLAGLSSQLEEEHHWARNLGESDKQSLAFARVALHRPDWLVMDDALISLDPDALAHVLTLLHGELKDMGMLDIGNGATPPGVFPREVAIVTEAPQGTASEVAGSEPGA
ncbi:ABC transporter ATP-binding protein/permease [Rhodobacter maris]|uniref:Putative ATP-binding cassette transporter n=1 Tax=Rhodobacter maris TaxID=446682 RepID=A0A285S563_9RHOB|nr:ABC transporter ATP-binding protein/permease [Rhodobacter maris]SOC00229.1 putative ATP-binding cassette transporter [Rhodobacter maris]